MSRPLRLQFPGALYHVTSRGDGGDPIFRDDADRETLLDVLARVVTDMRWVCHAYCLMGNHYHALIGTPEPNLSRGMRQLNGVYTQRFNRRHARSGHVFQGRYHAVLVDRDAYWLEAARYIVLNPVRAGLADRPEAWRWSSYRATAGLECAAGGVTPDALLGLFADDRRLAQTRYVRFVCRKSAQRLRLWDHLRQGCFLGSEAFVERVLGTDGRRAEKEIPRIQRAPHRPIEWYRDRYGDRTRAMTEAHRSGHHSFSEIARHFGVHYSTVSRVVRGVARSPRAVRGYW